MLCNSVQHGLLGGIPERGRFLTNSEHLVVQFQKLIVDAMTGQPAAPAAGIMTATPAVSRTVPVLPDASAAPDSGRNAYVELKIVEVEPESRWRAASRLGRIAHCWPCWPCWPAFCRHSDTESVPWIEATSQNSPLAPKR